MGGGAPLAAGAIGVSASTFVPTALLPARAPPEPAAPVAKYISEVLMFTSPTCGVQDTSPPTWFAFKSRSPKETAETLFKMPVSARVAGVVCSIRVDFAYTTM